MLSYLGISEKEEVTMELSSITSTVAPKQESDYRPSESLKSLLECNQFSVLVSDTKSSDLTIADPARIFGDTLAWCFYPGESEREAKAYNLVCQYFRDLTHPAVALPGARTLNKGTCQWHAAPRHFHMQCVSCCSFDGVAEDAHHP